LELAQAKGMRGPRGAFFNNHVPEFVNEMKFYRVRVRRF